MAENLINRIKRKILLTTISDYRKIDGWLSENEAIGLYSIARALPNNALIVEIGSWQGKSTYCISKGLKSGKVYAVDPFNKDAGDDCGTQRDYDDILIENSLYSNFKRNLTQFGVYDKIIVKRGYSYDFHEEFNEIDFLFIDGDHSIKGCKLDYDLYGKKIKPGGFIAFHDYYSKRIDLGPTYVVNEIVLKSNSFTFHNLFDSLWVGKKIENCGI